MFIYSTEGLSKQIPRTILRMFLIRVGSKKCRTKIFMFFFQICLKKSMASKNWNLYDFMIVCEHFWNNKILIHFKSTLWKKMVFYCAVMSKCVSVFRPHYAFWINKQHNYIEFFFSVPFHSAYAIALQLIELWQTVFTKKLNAVNRIMKYSSIYYDTEWLMLHTQREAMYNIVVERVHAHETTYDNKKTWNTETKIENMFCNNNKWQVSCVSIEHIIRSNGLYISSLFSPLSFIKMYFIFSFLLFSTLFFLAVVSRSNETKKERNF